MVRVFRARVSPKISPFVNMSKPVVVESCLEVRRNVLSEKLPFLIFREMTAYIRVSRVGHVILLN